MYVSEILELDACAVQAERLRLLHDVLETTPLAGRYWICGGLLLGWAREGAILAHDAVDADFNIRAQDVGRLHASVDALAQAGFHMARIFPSTAAAEPTEWVFELDGAHFEFFRVEIDGERMRWCNYGTNTDPASPHSHVQNVCEMPAQPLEEFDFLGRRWLKPLDHEAELTSLYGPWRTPDPAYDYMRASTIVETRAWDPSGYEL